MVAGNHPALQHHLRPPVGALPRPLPLFLDMVRRTAESDPGLARDALAGLRLYSAAPRRSVPQRPVAYTHGRASVIDGGGGHGPIILLVPSLINSSSVLDLAPGNSLLEFLATQGTRPYLLDWGCPTYDDRDQSIADHIANILVPIIRHFGEPVHLVGYCLGGTMAIAAACVTQVKSLSLLASPWHFGRYPADAKAASLAHWAQHRELVHAMGMMPVEFLQPLFWGLDPERSVAKFALLARQAPSAEQLSVFVALEDWANSGSPITSAAAAELFTALIRDDLPGSGRWAVADHAVDQATLPCPSIHFVASNDRISPAVAAPRTIATVTCPSGHVGMVTGRKAESGCWRPINDWIALHD